MANEQGSAQCQIGITCGSEMWLEGSTSGIADESLLEKSVIEGENPVSRSPFVTYGLRSNESRSLGLERKRVVNFIQSKIYTRDR